MHTDRGMMNSKKKPPANPLTKSMHLPGSSDKDSAGSSLTLGGIKLDFRKSSNGGGLMKMLTGGGGNSSNKISDDVRKSRESGFGSTKGNGVNAQYKSIEMTK